MKAVAVRQNAHGYHVIRRCRPTDTSGAESTTTADQKGHPCIEFNKIFNCARLEVPAAPPLDEDIVLFDRRVKGLCISLQATVLLVGKVCDNIGLKNVIPDSGPIDVELLGNLIHEIARRSGNWLGSDYSCARALCKYQANIPNQPRFNRLKFLFPGTIVFSEQFGIAIPMVEKIDGVWAVTYRDVLDQVVPGVDLSVT